MNSEVSYYIRMRADTLNGDNLWLSWMTTVELNEIKWK